jgi:DNA-binding phage protein
LSLATCALPNNYPGISITFMVRVPLTPDELERGRRLGEALRSARASRTMVDVATCAGLSPETLRKIETGRIATPAFSTIAAVAGVLGVSLDELWAMAEPEGDRVGLEPAGSILAS